MASSLIFLLFFFFFFLASLFHFYHARDTLTSGQSMPDGQTLTSAGEVFELGFFSPAKSSNRYVGIWYHDFSTDTVLWVANRQSPVKDTSGSLAIAADGNLVVLDGQGRTLWSSKATASGGGGGGGGRSSLQLTDTGNLVLNVSGSTMWQSFDHPADTYMPGMKVGLNLRTGADQMLTSWTSVADPAPGNFSIGMDPTASTQIFIWEGSRPRWRSGRWNGQVFIGIQDMVPQYIYGFKLNDFEQDDFMYFYYTAVNSSHRYVLTWEGIVKHLIRKKETGDWFQYWAQPVTACEFYNTCGNNAGCTDGANATAGGTTPICRCLRGFVPVNDEEWSHGNWSSGCRRRTPLGCGTAASINGGAGGGDGFLKMERVKLPDLSDWNNVIQDMDGCRQSCLLNCSCRAYAYVSGIRCLTWGVDLMDIHLFSDNSGNVMYLRLAGSELKDNKKRTLIIVIVVALVFLFGFILLMCKCRRRIKDLVRKPAIEENARLNSNRVPRVTTSSGSARTREKSNEDDFSELQLWSFDSILAATKDFSDSNLIGEGGFGKVYKGLLPEGEEIAVKRLSRNSHQGLEEFKNEVILISKLQHRNLVRLLACCIHEEERILIYEYMPNKSLDAFLFDPMKKCLLDWTTRYNIIEGIARGLVYLHRDSRLRIIHRDLKVSNILLDEEMQPKISDFGMARIFGNDDNEASTKRVVGTYGYMSPEYAMQGLFSVKSDVYSFGVLILEIVSGERNSLYRHPEFSMNLIAYAWKISNEDKHLEFIDPVLTKSCFKGQLVRCINLALMCLQDQPNDRPTMASVIAMLERESMSLDLPRQPTFTTDRSFTETDSSNFDLNAMSASVSITMVTVR